ncbi:MAG: alpha-amylase [Chitinophagaceae bacterium]|nr:alpha-amylase [Chitinophagaceae bacterium]
MNEKNYTIFQFFHWYFPPEDQLWRKCAEQASDLEELGVSHVWLPPAYKSAKGNQETGYAVYDLYDLGEFDQKGSVATKHGTKEEYLLCIQETHKRGIKVLADVVLNHMFEGDFEEEVPVIEVSSRNRNRSTSPRELIRAKTGFRYPGRAGKYSDFVWDFSCFTGLMEEGKIKLILNEYTEEGWDHLADKERGSFDYLMANDIEFRNPEVRKELLRWGEWYTKTTSVDGFRIDALKHIPPDFFPQWLDHLSVVNNRDYFSIGEYWKDGVEKLTHFISLTSRRIRLFDVPLHFNLHRASKEPGFDLRKVFKGSLVEADPPTISK